jgi:hypothetical protein
MEEQPPSWLAWQFGMQAIYLDMFIVPDGGTVEGWRTDDLGRAFESRRGRCTVVEGIMLLDALSLLGIEPNFFVYVRDAGRSMRPAGSPLDQQVLSYLRRQRPMTRADQVMTWKVRDR